MKIDGRGTKLAIGDGVKVLFEDATKRRSGQSVEQKSTEIIDDLSQEILQKAITGPAVTAELTEPESLRQKRAEALTAYSLIPAAKAEKQEQILTQVEEWLKRERSLQVRRQLETARHSLSDTR